MEWAPAAPLSGDSVRGGADMPQTGEGGRTGRQQKEEEEKEEMESGRGRAFATGGGHRL